MNMLYIKYGLIALGAIVATVTFFVAYKTLGPPTFKGYREMKNVKGGASEK